MAAVSMAPVPQNSSLRRSARRLTPISSTQPPFRPEQESAARHFGLKPGFIPPAPETSVLAVQGHRQSSPISTPPAASHRTQAEATPQMISPLSLPLSLLILKTVTACQEMSLKFQHLHIAFSFVFKRPCWSLMV